MLIRTGQAFEDQKRHPGDVVAPTFLQKSSTTEAVDNLATNESRQRLGGGIRWISDADLVLIARVLGMEPSKLLKSEPPSDLVKYSVCFGPKPPC